MEVKQCHQPQFEWKICPFPLYVHPFNRRSQKSQLLDRVVITDFDQYIERLGKHKCKSIVIGIVLI
jgi:hypothetical protein